ncbi:bifunctional protein FolD domain-containing protein [Mitosporidium daphniae]|uniref:methenyltetrahydrofolate cyclohydrolase n=1 Tax=Mitosporidium daphniae TaxID=1485682 RepID=A0A098VYG6_9MICR|nr:bifunctional protein FolD domain-containing protein [Mitosporidium daphniae]KGG52806.1 bifunctional protein FolD domain-containing protein [Mitosporidium daphniae]|eukprot:XP_013239242.1 bifunctional protein FolD domain-containing protein [Mitosporidium daphniae]
MQADILVSATGKGHFIPGSWLKSGSVIVDVGINVCQKTGSLIGDVCYQEAIGRDIAAITPVPGGIGPLTVAMLMENTVNATEESIKKNLHHVGF